MLSQRACDGYLFRINSAFQITLTISRPARLMFNPNFGRPPGRLHGVVMPGSILVNMTDRECDALAELSRELDLPQDRVLIQALRHYQASRHPVPSLPTNNLLCETCGIGFRLPSGRCDHCDTKAG